MNHDPALDQEAIREVRRLTAHLTLLLEAIQLGAETKSRRIPGVEAQRSSSRDEQQARVTITIFDSERADPVLLERLKNLFFRPFKVVAQIKRHPVVSNVTHMFPPFSGALKSADYDDLKPTLHKGGKAWPPSPPSA